MRIRLRESAAVAVESRSGAYIGTRAPEAQAVASDGLARRMIKRPQAWQTDSILVFNVCALNGLTI